MANQIVGLHMTKCAGTSLATFVRRHLSEDEYYLCSSFRENLLAGRKEFYDLLDTSRLKFVFGHYVHESLAVILPIEQSFWFTAVRHPLARVASAYAQAYAASRQSDRAPLDAATFAAQFSNGMCNELVRTFPTVANQNANFALHVQALKITEYFDYIYDSDASTDPTAPILQRLSIVKPMRIRENTRSSKNLAADDFFNEERAKLASLVTTYFSEDLLLYDALKSRLVPWDNSSSSYQDLSLRLRRELRKSLSDAEEARMKYRTFLMDHLISEFEFTGYGMLLRDSLQLHVVNAKEILARLRGARQTERVAV